MLRSIANFGFGTLASNAKTMFDADPKAKADLTAGTLYAIAGDSAWIYYGQVTPDKAVGFFRRRDRNLAGPEAVLSSDVMTTVVVAYPSIRRALRSGRWKKLGRFPLHKELQTTRYSVQWPAATLNVTVWAGGKPSHDTRVEDPAIQNMEIMAVLDAEHHIPLRLTADFGEEATEWHIGGPIWRERKVKEETARRFPDQPWHRLPQDWVPTDGDQG